MGSTSHVNLWSVPVTYFGDFLHKFDIHRHCVHNVVCTCNTIIVTSFSLSVVFTVTVKLPISQCSIIPFQTDWNGVS